MKKLPYVLMMLAALMLIVACPTGPEAPDAGQGPDGESFSGKVKVMLDLSLWDAGGKIAAVDWRIFPIEAMRDLDGELSGRAEPGADGKAELCTLDVKAGSEWGWSLKAYDESEMLLAEKSGKLKPAASSVELFSASSEKNDSRIIRIMVEDPVEEYADLASYAMLFEGMPVGEKDLMISGTGETLLLSFPYEGQDRYSWRLLPYSTGMSLSGGSDGILELEEGKDIYWLTPPSVDGLKTDHGMYPCPVELALMLAWDGAADADAYRVTISGRLSKVFSGSLDPSPMKIGTMDYARGAYYKVNVELLKGGVDGIAVALAEGTISAGKGASSFTLPEAKAPESGGGTVEPDVRTLTFSVDDSDWDGLPIKYYTTNMNGKELGIVARDASGTTVLGSAEADVTKIMTYEVQARDEHSNVIGRFRTSFVPGGSGDECRLTHPTPLMWVKEDFMVMKTEDGKWNVIDYAGDPEVVNITVPSTIAGIAVDGVSGYFPCTGKLTISEGIRALGVMREDRMRTIGGKFTSLSVPSSVRAMASSIFSSCESLRTADIDADVTELPYSAFSGCLHLESITLPAGIRTIKGSAFEDCTGLSSVSGPTALEVIGMEAFKRCKALKSFDFRPTIREIHPYAFAYSGLESADLTGLEKLGTGAFKDTCLLTVTVPGGLEILTDPSLGESVESGPFEGTKVSTDEYAARRPVRFTLTGTWNEVPWYLFSGAFIDDKGTEPGDEWSFALPDTVAKLGKYAFRAACTVSGGLTLPSGLEELGISSFEGAGFSKIVLPETGPTALPRDTFYNCKKLVTVNVPSTVTGIGDRAFFGCNLIDELVLPDGLLTIGERAFCGLTAVESMTIPDGVTVYPEGMLQSCTKLKTFTAGSAVTEVGAYAFMDTAITDLVLPESCTDVDASAFSGMKDTSTVTLNGICEKDAPGFDTGAKIVYRDTVPVAP